MSSIVDSASSNHRAGSEAFIIGHARNGITSIGSYIATSICVWNVWKCSVSELGKDSWGCDGKFSWFNDETLRSISLVIGNV